MDQLKLYTSIYSLLKNRQGIPFWIFTPFRRLVRACANKWLPKYLAKTCNQDFENRVEVIVSFTSFPVRINNVWQVVECMLRQTVKPTKILLWLSKEQFKDTKSIPKSLREREGNIFEIRLVDGDIRSHKKYYYVSMEFPNSLIFLIDDDVYYPTDIIEKSLKAREHSQNSLICNYGYQIGYNADGTLKPYNTWKHFHITQANNIFFGSGGGTLFKPSELFHDLTNIKLAMKVTPIADDIWLNAMARLANLKIIMVSNNVLLPIYNRMNTTLSSINRNQCENDRQLDAVMNVYNNVFMDSGTMH